MKRWTVLLAVLFIMATGSAALAGTDSAVRYHFYGGYSGIAGDFSDVVKDGWNIDFGGVYKPNPTKPFGLRWDISYDWYDLKTGSIPNVVKIDSGTASVWSIRLGAQFESKKSGKAHFYGGLGMGGYRLYADLRQTALYDGYYCDPWWGYCYGGVYAGEAIVASDYTTKLGYYVNAGVEFPTGPGGIFIEGQYHWVQTKTSFEYYPIVLGYRW
jgi:hypothetical protein